MTFYAKISDTHEQALARNENVTGNFLTYSMFEEGMEIMPVNPSKINNKAYRLQVSVSEERMLQ